MAETKLKSQAIKSETYTEATLANSWDNYGSGLDTAAYLLDSIGFVHLRGGIKSGTIGQTAFTLPTGYRPANTLYFNVFCWNGSAQALARVGIYNDGRVIPDLGYNNHISLDGILFKADQ